MEYSVTIQDIQDYLATVPEGVSVAIPQHNYDCLMGKTLQRKYPGELGLIGYHNQYVSIGDHDIEPPNDVQEECEKFDNLWPVWDSPAEYEDDEDSYPPITLAVLRERIPQLFEKEENINA